MQTLDRDEVTVHVDVPPDEVYPLIADVTRMPEFSPEIIPCTWLDGARLSPDPARPQLQQDRENLPG